MSEAPAKVKQTETQINRSYETNFEGDSLEEMLEAIDTFVGNELDDEPEYGHPGVMIKVFRTDEGPVWKGSVIITYDYDVG